MLLSKFQGKWSRGYVEEDFFKIFTMYGHDGHLSRDLDK